MPAVSEAQRRYLNAHFGHDWVKRHHFDNPGPLPAHVHHQEKPVSSILDSILGAAGGSSSHGLPPDLTAAIGAGGGGSDSSEAGEQNAVDILSQMIKLCKQYMDVEPDEEDKAIVAQCLTQLQKLKAKDQSEIDGAMQGKTTPRMVRKAAVAQGGPGGPGY